MKQRVMLIIIIASLLLVGSAALAQSAHSERESVGAVSDALSGGLYVLTIQTTGEVRPTGYRLLNSPQADLPGSGCCCLGYLPCTMK